MEQASDDAIEPASVPIESGPEGINPHPPHTGRKHIDTMVAALAIVISLISLGVGFENARSEQQMVAANSWPFLVYNSSKSSGEIEMQISNRGVGPARIKSLSVSYNGQSAAGLRQLLSICCGLPKGTSWESLTSTGNLAESRAVGVVSPRESVELIRISRTPENSAMWDRLDQARNHLTLSACYCSVLDACWVTDLSPTSDPKPVSECKTGTGYIE